MGMGLQTQEEVVYDAQTGALLSDGTWTYKIPTAACIPRRLNVTFLKVIVAHSSPHVPVFDTPFRLGQRLPQKSGNVQQLLTVAAILQTADGPDISEPESTCPHSCQCLCPL